MRANTDRESGLRSPIAESSRAAAAAPPRKNAVSVKAWPTVTRARRGAAGKIKDQPSQGKSECSAHSSRHVQHP